MIMISINDERYIMKGFLIKGRVRCYSNKAMSGTAIFVESES